MKTTLMFYGDETGLHDQYPSSVEEQGSPNELYVPDPEFGRRVMLRRKALGLTQIELAQAVGIGQSMMSRYENGTHPLSKMRRAQIENVLRRLEI